MKKWQIVIVILFFLYAIAGAAWDHHAQNEAFTQIYACQQFYFTRQIDKAQRACTRSIVLLDTIDSSNPMVWYRNW